MIGRNDLTATIVTRPGERPRLRVLAGPGWVEGEHGQDLAEGLRQLTGVHMGDWVEVSRSPGAQVARCTKKACDWATRPIPHGRPTPTTCEACGAPAGLEAVADAGEVILLEQASAPTRAQRLEREFRAAKPQRRAAAARAWAQALCEERGVGADAAQGLLAQLADKAQRKASPADLEQLVRRGVELACPAPAPVPSAAQDGTSEALSSPSTRAKPTRKRTKKGS